MQQTLVDGRYCLVEALGSGGMAKVYLARDEVLGRNVALKVLREQYAEDERFIERFRREAQSAASLSHPNIVSVYDRGRAEDGAYYMIMEHVPGGTLKDKVLAEGPLDPGEAARLAAEVAEALAAAHAEGVVHRDVKPQNVLLTGSALNAAKVADFGIARAASASALSGTGMVLGTASYMSPEQAKGEPVGPASDLYSLGVVLYEILVGALPYEAESPLAVAMKHVTAPPPPPRRSNPDVPANLNAIVAKLLRKHPEDRYASAAELAEDLRRARGGLPPRHAAGPEEETRGLPESVAVEGPPAPGTTRARRRRLPPTLAGPVALLALVGAVLWGLLGGYGESSGGLGETFEEVRRAFGLGGVEVPGVVGYDEATAREQLDNAGLEAEVSLVESPEEDAGEVLSQSVPEGATSREGEAITLEVGDGPAVAQVPDLAGLSLQEAEDSLTEADLALGEQEEAPSATVPEGGVTGQDPSPGAEAEEGDTVNLVLSSGPAEPAAATPSTPAATPPPSVPEVGVVADTAEIAPAAVEEEVAAPAPRETATPAAPASAPKAQPSTTAPQPSSSPSASDGSASNEDRVVRKESGGERESSGDREGPDKSEKSD